jgi:gluconolactonase
MHSLISPGAKLELLSTGCEWSEGPVWLGETSSLRWSDIPNNRILEFDASSGRTRLHRGDAEYPNGRTLDLGGNVLQCSHGRRAIEREVDGIPWTIVDHWQGARFNSPNDIVVASDGAIWFTDPPYGIRPDGREGHPGRQEYGGCYVFRFDERDQSLTAPITDMARPNGLAFSPDESILYVSDTSWDDVPGGLAHIRAYDVIDGVCTNGRIFAIVQPGVSDGFRIDAEGRIWSSSADAVQVFSPAGELLERIPVPEQVANLCFGGDDGHDLYITASTSLYRIRTTTTETGRSLGSSRDG